MDETSRKRYLIIHGHFYQPPRENPWTERVEREESAFPYHDWNDRISTECYHSNARSRRLDGFGRITRLVNNYEYLSFNFGPTLLSWIEGRYPGLIDQITDADRASAGRLGGHGNAIAQVYNHVIMPLAEIRDQKTQIEWGIFDFKRRFERDPEGIWLAETAINSTTLELLIDFGFRFVILSPYQAEKFRPLEGTGEWTSSENGTIPTGRAYRSYGQQKKGKRGSKKFIDIFFYDARLSSDISFNHLLSNGDNLAESISSSFARCGGDLVTIATDGEIYGHHEAFGDMALAYLIDEGAEKHGITFTNFSSYLKTHETGFEVLIKTGKKDEGTAWSCSHGVDRWKDDCGCQTGGAPGWNQKWRKPLRNGLDMLRDRLREIYEKEAASLLSDPWKARDDYISAIHQRSFKKIEAFIRERAVSPLSEEGVSRACRLLESQRNSLLMYTSCGWFFNDISGIETVQLLKYAARAIELVGNEQAEKIENEFLLFLEKAKSNLPSAGNGKDLYLKMKKSSSVDPVFLAGQYALASSLSCPDASPEKFGYEFSSFDTTEIDISGISMQIGRISMASPYTLEKYNYKYVLIIGTPAQVACAINECANDEEFEKMKGHFSSTPSNTGFFDITATMSDYFGEDLFALNDLFVEDREKILGMMASRQMDQARNLFENLYIDSREILRLFSSTSLSAPESILAPARAVLEERLSDQLERWKEDHHPAVLEEISKIISESVYYGIKLDKGLTIDIFTDFFLTRLSSIRGGLSKSVTDQLYKFVEYCHEFGADIPQHGIQNEIFAILESLVEEAIGRILEDPAGSTEDLSAVTSFLRLAERFNFNVGSWQERLPE
ncbi:MAG: DUF3536 domain-containing protein [Candidatus Krumholzibacteriota bacterium]|nr:DUF3536 domain-containing protein [Candidatus Krumholzibacteriota bacterium]